VRLQRAQPADRDPAAQRDKLADGHSQPQDIAQRNRV